MIEFKGSQARPARQTPVGKVRPIFTVVPEPAAEKICSGSIELGESTSVIDDIVREGARRMLAEALQG